MGRITVRDLCETAPRSFEIVAVDRDVTAARQATKGINRRVAIVEADAARPRQLRRALAGAAVTINACHHSLNLRVMDGALAAGSHYCDLGGLFHVTREQLLRHREFRAAGLLALCGIGSAPGIVNVMARDGADRLDRVDEVHIAVGTVDRTRRIGASPLQTSYTIETVLDEASQPAAVFTGGRLRFVEPLSHAQRIRFPAPVGEQDAACSIHSELATLPAAFRSKGVREVSFRIAFPDGLAERLRFLTRLGMTSTKDVEVNGRPVAPRDVLRALLRSMPAAKAAGPPDEYEILRVLLRGRRARQRVEDVLDCHVPGMPAWNVGVDIDTGSPPSIVTQMLLDGRITARGVRAPESAVPAVPFFRELARRRMRITRRTRRG
jgi:saccharopine dehydrogenase-like NADP-dependent oxidoreductase